MPTYVLRAGDTDKVKIGWSAEDVEARRRDLQIANWVELSVLRIINGPASIERWMHRRFAHLRIRGEWFTFCEEMLTVEPSVMPVVPVEDEPPAPLTARYIEQRAKAAGITMPDACERAGIAASTFYRWRNGQTSPTIDVYERLWNATQLPEAA